MLEASSGADTGKPMPWLLPQEKLLSRYSPAKGGWFETTLQRDGLPYRILTLAALADLVTGLLLYLAGYLLHALGAVAPTFIGTSMAVLGYSSIMLGCCRLYQAFRARSAHRPQLPRTR